MQEAVYKIVELTGSSKKGLESAIQNALHRASQSIRNMRWFQVTDTRGYIEEGKVSYWQVTLKVGFHVEGENS
jgi:flavin-binding protein dodecin